MQRQASWSVMARSKFLLRPQRQCAATVLPLPCEEWPSPRPLSHAWERGRGEGHSSHGNGRTVAAHWRCGRSKNLERAITDQLAWRCIGPFRGGRVVAVAADARERATFYFGS